MRFVSPRYRPNQDCYELAQLSGGRGSRSGRALIEPIIYHRVGRLRNDLSSVQGLSQLFAVINWMTIVVKPSTGRCKALRPIAWFPHPFGEKPTPYGES